VKTEEVKNVPEYAQVGKTIAGVKIVRVDSVTVDDKGRIKSMNVEGEIVNGSGWTVDKDGWFYGQHATDHDVSIRCPSKSHPIFCM
jgi:hypothetical protein